MTGSDKIFSDQDWNRTEQFHNPLISAAHPGFTSRFCTPLTSTVGHVHSRSINPQLVTCVRLIAAHAHCETLESCNIKPTVCSVKHCIGLNTSSQSETVGCKLRYSVWAEGSNAYPVLGMNAVKYTALAEVWTETESSLCLRRSIIMMTSTIRTAAARKPDRNGETFV